MDSDHMIGIKIDELDNQSGGAAPVCDMGSSSNMMMNIRPPIGIHNLNPQASLDLDNKFMAYGTPVPLGSNILSGGGLSGGGCGDEGVGTANPVKSETFKQYLDNLSKSLEIPQQGGFQKASENMLPNNSNSHIPSSIPDMPNKKMHKRKLTKRQMGGGFTTDPSQMIAGQPVYSGYDDCCPPAIVGGKLEFASPDKPLCGLGAVAAGGARRRRSSKHNNKHHSKLHRKSKRDNKKTSRRHSKRRSQRHSRRSQRGGDFNSVGRSKPAAYADAFNGEPGVFDYPVDMSKRTFDGKQPSWSVNNL